MLAMVYALPVVFGLMVWRTYRAHRAIGGRRYEPEGKVRWEEPS
jgi:hypothetical protein